jgi:tetratricopeptide (TPR) repeat protein
LVVALAGDATASACAEPAATLVSLQGSVDVQRKGQSEWAIVALDDSFCPGDSLRTRSDSRADVLLGDQSVLRVRENTTLVVEGITSESSYVLDLLQGAAHFFSRQGARNLEVKTPFTVAGVRGTEFSIDVSDSDAVVRVFKGSVLAANSVGSLALADGQTAVVEKGLPPVLKLEAKPRDAVRWTLYYQPVLYTPPSARGAASADSASLRSLNQSASQNLATGNVDAAMADLDQALAANPHDADALALRTIVALAQNDKEEASRAAEQAVAADPTSPAARIALSYAAQAHFDLEGARAALEEAVTLSPDNALAWARLAEIRSSLGESRAALEAAERAATIDPELARTQTVLGFAYLTRIDVDEATAAFEKAIALDSADPLPRLGLGLAKIRSGDLRGGGRQVEIAASLDPSNALVRSYLGKVYFEEKREKLDEREYAVAKELDPNDPTPYFYDAIAKQTTNRPVEALRNLEKAIELNDNRAVYRSRLLLDSDLAARSASLGRIYSDLGFQSLALVEGWKSVNGDPGNHSAHRLLADSYAALPRHEIARVSELMQSQLLQPNNITPIQPRLGESNLQLLSSQGAAALSFTEFNPLFNRNQIAIQESALVGENDTLAGEAIVSGIWNKASFSAGYSGFQTDGFRDNNDQNDDIVSAFAQLELTPETSVQAEFRYRDLENGDLELRFIEDDFSRFLEEHTTTKTARVGLRHTFGPATVLLASYIHQKLDNDFSDFVPDPVFGDFSIDLDVEEKGDSGEIQLIHRASTAAWTNGWIRGVNVVAGAGHLGVDSDETTTTLIDPGFPLPPDIVTRNPDVQHTNAYAYTHTDLPAQVTLTLGVSGDFFDEDDGIGDESQANPKAGLTWTPWFSERTTFRAAAFRTLTRTLVTQQTLEPTQVAGFNQFYDDPPGTDAWRYGVAVDHKLTRSLFMGIEASKRDLEVPLSIFGAGNVIVQKDDWDESLLRSYLFWTPHEWVAARVEHQYEELERDEDSLFAFEKVKTHRVPLGLQFFHPSGIGASLGATYLNQDGDFLRNSDFTFQSGDRDFWILDAGLRYRLPKRRGFVSVGVNNFLDEDATYQATDVRNPGLIPGRFVFGSITLAIP